MLRRTLWLPNFFFTASCTIRLMGYIIHEHRLLSGSKKDGGKIPSSSTVYSVVLSTREWWDSYLRRWEYNFYSQKKHALKGASRGHMGAAYDEALFNLFASGIGSFGLVQAHVVGAVLFVRIVLLNGVILPAAHFANIKAAGLREEIFSAHGAGCG